jgi:hypothetical protein
MIFDGYRGVSILSLCVVPHASHAPWILVGGSHIKGAPSLNVEIWNIETGEKVANCRGCRYQICGIDARRVLDEDGHESFIAVAGGLDCKTRCWNLDSILLDEELHNRDFMIDLESVVTGGSLASMFAESETFE